MWLLPNANHPIPLPVKIPVVVCGGVVSTAVVPDGNISDFPAVANLDVVVFGNVAEEEIQQDVRFFWLELDDALGEPVD